MPQGKPILVTGSHRSGSSWVGRMIALSPAVGYVQEPLSLYHRPGTCAVRFPLWLTYLCEENGAVFEGAIRDTLGFRYRPGAELRALRSPKDAGRMLRDWAHFARCRARGARSLLKDPIAIFSAPWLASRFDMQVVVMVRHPAAFVSSLKKLEWRHPFDHFLRQPLLMRDVLQPFRGDIEWMAAGGGDVVDEGILLWRLINATVARYREEHPGWIYLRHEDLSLDPLSGFADLYARLGLEFDERVRTRVARHTDPGNPVEEQAASPIHRDSRAAIWTWQRRLTEGEIRRIRHRTEDVWPAFYTERDWELPVEAARW